MTVTVEHIADSADVKEVLELSSVVAQALPMTVSERTHAVLQDLARRLAPLRDQGSRLLTAVPRDPLGRIDVRDVEGTGFYEEVDGLWLYHKGGGSVEAAAYFEREGGDGVRFPGFGAEIPGAAACYTYRPRDSAKPPTGTSGASSSTVGGGDVAEFGVRLLGIKLLRQMVHEFFANFLVLVDFIEREGIADADSLFGRCTVPLSVLTIPALSATLRARLHDKPLGSQRFYGDVTGGFEVAKLVAVVPGPVRGTDDYRVDGKWAECPHTFVRCRSLGPGLFHHAPTNPYWDVDQAFARGAGVRRLLDAGFAHQIFSSHLQNLYAAPGGVLPGPFSPMADGCDLVFLEGLAPHEIERHVLHQLAGWRSSESLGPSPCPNPGVSFRLALRCTERFFAGFLGDQEHPGLGALFMLVPESVALAVARHLTPSLAAVAGTYQAWRTMIDGTPWADEAERVVDMRTRDHHGFGNRLLEPVRQLRPPALVRLIGQGLFGSPDRRYEALLDFSGRLSAVLDEEESAHERVGLWRAALELEAWCGDQALDRLLAAGVDRPPRDAFSQAWEHHSSRLSSLPAPRLGRWIEDAAEEMLHRTGWRLARRIESAAAASDLRAVRDGLDHLLDVSARLVSSPSAMVSGHLTFLFKRRGLLEAIQSLDAARLVELLQSSWTGGPTPVVRDYPRFRLSSAAWEALADGESGPLLTAARDFHLSLLWFTREG